MTRSKTGRAFGSRHFPVGAALLAIAPSAMAQQVPQMLTVAFSNVNATVPLSDWLTAGIALLLGVTAVFALRRRPAQGGRVLGWMLAIIAGTMLVAPTGRHFLSEAQAGPQALQVPSINLTVSPGTLNVAPYSPSSPLNVTVTNSTSQTVTLTSITLDSGPYALFGASTCSTSLPLAPNGTCVITLSLQES
jgi:hypothetical protein